jgi:hypothetical protein
MHLSRIGLAVVILLGSGASATAQNYPSAHITNGVLSAELYLPDPIKGSYRATRFDWSGIIRSLTYKGHDFFGQWYEVHDPLVHDAITGPVNVFQSSGSAIGYEEARVGGTFLRIGVGHVEKPDEPVYRETNTYKVADPGTWRIDQKPGSIRFTQELSPRGGYGYSYSKTVYLTPGKPEMVLLQELKNTGSKPIDTTVFNHGFFQIDREPAGPGLIWTFHFQPRTPQDFSDIAEIRGNQIAYLRELKAGERLLVLLEGYGSSVEGHHFTLENLKTGAGVRVAGDHPITRLTFWSRRMAYSPEASIHLHVAPGKVEKWQTQYEFYTLESREKTR